MGGGRGIEEAKEAVVGRKEDKEVGVWTARESSEYADKCQEVINREGRPADRRVPQGSEIAGKGVSGEKDAGQDWFGHPDIQSAKQYEALP